MGQIEYFAEKNTQRQKEMSGKLDAFLSTFRAQSNLFLLSMWVMTDWWLFKVITSYIKYV